MKLEILLRDNKWKIIRHYLLINNVTHLDSLSLDMINELYFVPGVSYNLIDELKYMLANNSFSNNLPNKQCAKTPRDLLNKGLEEDEHENNIATDEYLSETSNEQLTQKKQKSKYWFSNLPWETIVKDLKIKNSFKEIIYSRGIYTVNELISVLPVYLKENEKGVRAVTVSEYNGFFENRIKQLIKYDSLSNAQNEGVINELTWENYYSKIDRSSIASNLPNSLINLNLLDFLEMENLEYDSRISRRLQEETLYSFLNKDDYKYRGISSSHLGKFLTCFFKYLYEFISKNTNTEGRIQLEFEGRFPFYKKSLKISHLKKLLRNTEFDKLFSVAKKYSINTLNEFIGKKIEGDDYYYIYPIVKKLEIDYLDNINKLISTYSNERYNIVLKRSLGATLDEIGNSVGLTRERVRQIINKFSSKALMDIEYLAKIIEADRGYFMKEDWLFFQIPDEHMSILELVINEKSKEYEYLWYTGQYISKDSISNNWQDKLNSIVEKKSTIFGDIHELYERIVVEIHSLNIYFLNEENFSNYLDSQLKYKILHGSYIKPGVNTGEILAIIIEKNFSFDIKLDSNDDNEDLKILREIMRKQFPEIKIPDNNRNLTAVITRNPQMVLSDRGRYVNASRVYFPKFLQELIYSWILEKNSTLTYKEVFEHFKGQLIFESNINNSSFLHGALQYYYEDEFDFRRDTFVPMGKEHVSTGKRLHKLIDEQNILSLEDIQQKIPGIKDYQIFAIVERSEDLFNRGNNEITSIKFVNFNREKDKELLYLLQKELEENLGFTSAKAIFERMQDSNIINNEDILNEAGIFQYLKLKFKDKFNFRYPYILTESIIPHTEIITFSKVIHYFFVEGQDIIDRSKIEKFSKKYGLSNLSIYQFFQENSEKLIRISKEKYILKDNSDILSEDLNNIDNYLADTIDNFLPLVDFRNYNDLPNIEYEWNEFLLEDLIAKFGKRIRLIDRKTNYSHFISSIAVPLNSNFKNYEDLVISVMKSNNKKSLNTREMLKLLQTSGLTSVAIPVELSNGEQLWFNPRSDLYQLR
ncbi:hypothetical protein SAMN04488569_10706 [Marinilactibacillus piezotolerans]|uniref:Sigma-70, region 4 n=1 Tax=Marinilactibacillus piezotolerans TaxID=258723 RepID=A0A1I4BEP6_9LACT|nr:hypothetical protein [Marinilactibacillus piezotolerans]SFK67322.1 hypothetical protein SAMN04488569_10706 [Marinilactibacillus piezotolerans]